MVSLAPLRRIALVTGASQGLGRSIALRLADDGLDVAVNDIRSKSTQLEDVVSEIKAKGGKAVAVPADVSVEEEVKHMTAQAVEKLGGLDVMVANAAIVILKPLVETSAEDWDRISAINMRGAMLSYKYAAIQMIRQGRGGRIIGASSLAGRRGLPDLSAYSATKFAVRGLTQSAALELARHKITVNAYAPGKIVTPMSQQYVGTLSDDNVGSSAAKHPEMPSAEPEVIASIVSYLAKPEAYFITGQTITVDGGVSFD